MSNLSSILTQLQTERTKVSKELDRLDAAISALRSAASNGSVRPRRQMSVAARKKIAAAQRARWAAWKAKQKKAA
jgi:hypothetical protein